MGVLITGGAGYIGSHVTTAFMTAGFEKVVVLDNLSTGDKQNVIQAPLIIGDIRDTDFVQRLLIQHKIDTVCHLAASTVIPESIQNPSDYYDNNVTGTLNLLKACHQVGVKHFIFSSTAAVYAPSEQPVNEQSLCAPGNPYGHSKWMGEQIVRDFAQAFSMNAIILRYFNVAGASPCGKLGQRGVATHLIKNVVRTALNLQDTLPVFGTNYDTPDGTCIRDFVHVCDIANAHVAAFKYLQQHTGHFTFNCGYGKGYSVKSVIDAMERIVGKRLAIENRPRRAGDLRSVIADNRAILQTLDWQPTYDNLDKIVETAYAFERDQFIR